MRVRLKTVFGEQFFVLQNKITKTRLTIKNRFLFYILKNKKLSVLREYFFYCFNLFSKSCFKK